MLDPHEFCKFDVDEFIKSLEEFKEYFKKEVKLINKVTLLKNRNEYTFIVDIPSTDFEIIFGEDIDKEGRYYYMKFWCFPFEISYIKITKEQFDKILKICEEIYDNAKERESEFEKARLEVLRKVTIALVRSIEGKSNE